MQSLTLSFIAAKPGMGKTSSMAMLAMKYVDGETEGRSVRTTRSNNGM